MLHPFTVPASCTSLDPRQQLKCICGKDVTLGNCLCVWTQLGDDPELGYYAACSPMCVIIHVSAGSA